MTHEENEMYLLDIHVEFGYVRRLDMSNGCYDEMRSKTDLILNAYLSSPPPPIYMCSCA